MPQIKQYEAPENLGLRPTEAGVTATAAAARRVGSQFSEAAAAQQATGARIGSAINIAGDIAVKYLDHQQISQGAPAFAGLMAAKETQWNDTVKKSDPNDPTVAAKFMEGVEADLEKFKTGFMTERAQAWAESRVDQFRTHLTHKTSADMSRMAGEAAAINQRQTMNSLSVAVRSDPTSLDFGLDTLESSHNAVVGTSNISAAQMPALSIHLQKNKEALVKAAALGHIEKTGEIPSWVTEGKYSKYVDADDLKKFQLTQKFYNNQFKTADRAAQVQAEHNAKLKFNHAINQLELSTSDADGNPVVGPQHVRALNEIVQANPLGAALEPGLVRTMKNSLDASIARMNKPEPMARVSHETSMDLLTRIRASDATRLPDLNEVYDAYKNGKLTNADFNFLKKEFTDLRTPEGERLAATKTEFFKAVAPQIDKSNPLMGKLDQDGKLNMYRMEWDINQKIAEYRKAGKNPYDLFNPNNPDYVGTPAALQPYQKPLNQSIRDQADKLTGRRGGAAIPSAPAGAAPPAVTPPAPQAPKVLPKRLPGETPAAYMKRIGEE